jgi:hypothetical protein
MQVLTYLWLCWLLGGVKVSSCRDSRVVLVWCKVEVLGLSTRFDGDSDVLIITHFFILVVLCRAVGCPSVVDEKSALGIFE